MTYNELDYSEDESINNVQINNNDISKRSIDIAEKFKDSNKIPLISNKSTENLKSSDKNSPKEIM